MANVSRLTLPPSMFIPDEEGIIDGSDVPAVQDNLNGRVCWKFPDGSDESAIVSQPFVVPSQITSGNSLILRLFTHGDAAPGGSSGVAWQAAWEAITESDAHDLEGTGDAFAAAQAVNADVDAAAGELNVDDISFSQAQADAIEPGDYARIVIRRDSDDAVNDDYADSVWLTAVELLEVT